MSEYVDLCDDLVEKLQKSFQTGPILDNGRILLNEVTMTWIEPHIKVSTFSNEIEKPHFRLDFKGKNCRYDIYTCEPLDTEPREISQYRKNILKWYNEHRDELIKFYDDHLADNAPPQSRIHR